MSGIFPDEFSFDVLMPSVFVMILNVCFELSDIFGGLGLGWFFLCTSLMKRGQC